jgi:hypothetical protein
MLLIITDIYDYDGPVVVLTKLVCEYAGETESSSVCVFCDGLYKKLTTHIRAVHKKEPRVLQIEKAATAAEREAGFLSLMREGNFNSNIRCITNDRGYIFTCRRSNTFHSLGTMIHCIRCYLFIQRQNFRKHMHTCPQRKKGPCNVWLADLWQQNL